MWHRGWCPMSGGTQTSRRMRAMVGFRNIAVHDYQKLGLEVVKSILDDFRTFSKVMLGRDAGSAERP